MPEKMSKKLFFCFVYIFVFCSVDLRCSVLFVDVGEFDKFELELLLLIILLLLFILFIKFVFERLFIISAVVADIFVAFELLLFS